LDRDVIPDFKKKMASSRHEICASCYAIHSKYGSAAQMPSLVAHVRNPYNGQMLNSVDFQALKPLALKYIWWKTPDEALAMPQRVIAQVMNIGDYDDVQSMAALVGDAALREALAKAQAGQFSPRSWAYWHYRLGLRSDQDVPAMPQRSLA
jgi:hypothetical protein